MGLGAAFNTIPISYKKGDPCEPPFLAILDRLDGSVGAATRWIANHLSDRPVRRRRPYAPLGHHREILVLKDVAVDHVPSAGGLGRSLSPGYIVSSMPIRRMSRRGEVSAVVGKLDILTLSGVIRIRRLLRPRRITRGSIGIECRLREVCRLKPDRDVGVRWERPCLF